MPPRIPNSGGAEEDRHGADRGQGTAPAEHRFVDSGQSRRRAGAGRGRPPCTAAGHLRGRDRNQTANPSAARIGNTMYQRLCTQSASANPSCPTNQAAMTTAVVTMIRIAKTPGSNGGRFGETISTVVSEEDGALTSSPVSSTSP